MIVVFPVFSPYEGLTEVNSTGFEVVSSVDDDADGDSEADTEGDSDALGDADALALAETDGTGKEPVLATGRFV